MANQSSTGIDEDLSGLEKDGLKWSPWIGQSFLDLGLNERLLIVGESHYHNPERLAEVNVPKNLTRYVVENEAIIGDPKHKTFPNLHKALLGEENFDSRALWDHVSFYNFVQRLLEGSKDRPKKMDFDLGWGVFFKLIEMIKPSTCLFVGKSAANFLSNTSDYVELEERGKEPINRVYPRIANLKIKGNQPIKMIFIKHTSSYFRWKDWNLYLSEVMKPQLDFLKSKVQIQ